MREGANFADHRHLFGFVMILPISVTSGVTEGARYVAQLCLCRSFLSVKRHPARITLLESNGAGQAADSSGISSRGCSSTSATMVRGTRSSSRRSVARTCGLAWNARWKGWSNRASALASRIIP
jgi:hypothetical protein